MRKTAFALLFLLVTLCTQAISSTCPTGTICAPALLNEISIKEQTAGYSIGIKYPVLCSSEATRTVRDHVTRSLSEFKADFPEHDLSDYPHKHEMITEYSIWEAGSGRYASVKLQVMVFTGGAHPNHWPVTWVFDLTNGAALTLDDIFIDVQNSLKAIAPMMRKTLYQSLGDMANPDMLDDGTRPVMPNYDGFIINNEGIAFFFAPYQVAPYAAGQQVVTIPWGNITFLIQPELLKAIK